MENSENLDLEPKGDEHGSIKTINRIYDYPIVKDSFSKAGEYYQWIKGQNSTLNSTMCWSENQFKVIINKVEPIAADKLQSVDKFACDKLDTIEKKYPIVKEPTDNVIQSTQEFYNSNMKPTVDKLASAKDSAVYVAATPYRVTSNTLEYLSSTANNFVHHYLSSSTNSDGNETVENKNNQAVYSKAIKELDLVKNFTLETVGNLNKLLNSVYENKVKGNEAWIKKCYDEYCKELENKGDSSDKSTDSQVSKLALSYTNKLRVSLRAMSTVCYNHLSDNNKQKMDDIFQKSEQLYTSLKNCSIDDVKQSINRENAKYIMDHAVIVVSDVKNSLTEKYKQVTGKVPEEGDDESDTTKSD